MTPIHIMFLLGAVPAIAYGDYLGMSWARGRRETLDVRTLVRLHYWVYVCLVGLIATGMLMFLSRPFLLQNPAFIMKMIFVGALIINSVLIGSHMQIAGSKPFTALSAHERRRILVSGGVSVVAWFGAVIGGLMIG